MFTINQRTKKNLMAILAVGLIALILGFIQVSKNKKEEIFKIAKIEFLENAKINNEALVEELKDVRYQPEERVLLVHDYMYNNFLESEEDMDNIELVKSVELDRISGTVTIVWNDEVLKESQIIKRENVEAIFHKIEEELHFEFTDAQIENTSCINDIIGASSKDINQSFFSRLWAALLFNNYFFLGIAVFAVFFVALQYVAEAGWSIVLKRVPEAIMGALPLFSLIMLFIIVAAIMHWNHIYHWLHEGIMDPANDHYDKIIAGKEAWLNPAFFIIRTIIYLLGWNYFAKRLRALSVLEDKQGGTAIHFKGVRASAWFIVFFAVTSAMASWDWIMSIDPHWFSTIFGWYVFAEWSAIGFTAVLLVTLYLKRKGHLKDVNENHIHDLGKWVFAFSLVWTYIWFSQFMLIWYPNIPEEVAYYVARLQDYDNGVANNYKFLFWFSMIINFITPLVLLISRPAKRNNGMLIFVSCIILVGHWLNSYLLVTPGALGINGHIGATEIGVGLIFTGLFIYLVLNSLTKQPLETKNHPFLDESKHLDT